jgi:hypothetical protein
VTRRRAAALLAILLAIALAAPFLRAGRLGEPIRAALERALGRRVEIGDVRIRLLPSPGFSLARVTIHEDPAFGVEPLAYVGGTIDLAVRLPALLRGRLEFSSIRMNRPHVNLQWRESGWNVPLFGHALDSARRNRAAPPEIALSAARINFKTGDRKSVVYLSETDLELAPSASGDVAISFSAAPARSDRPAHGYGGLRGNGRLRNGNLALDLNLDRTAISDLMVLAHGRDLGLTGFVTAGARITGPAARLAIAGQARFQDLPRWSWLLPGASPRGIEFHGQVELPPESIEIETVATAALPLALRIRARRDGPGVRWALSAVLKDLPVQSALALARQTGIAAPEIREAAGRVTGAVGYDPEEGLQGGLRLSEISVGLPGEGAARIASATLTVDRDRLHLAPAQVSFGERETAVIEARVDPRSTELRIQTARMPVDQLRNVAAAAIGDVPPVVAALRGGWWRGALRYTRAAGGEAAWSGTLDLSHTSVAVDGLDAHPQVESARVEFKGRQARMRASVQLGEGLTAAYSFDPSAAIPHHLDLDAAAFDWALIERTLGPTLDRRRGFLARTLRRGRARAPAWLASRNVAGRLRVGRLDFAGVVLEAMQGRFRWNGLRCEVQEFTAEALEGDVAGRLALDLSAAEAAWIADLRFRHLDWQGGRLDADARLRGRGTGEDLMASLRGDGLFEARSVRIPPEGDWRRVSGVFALRPGAAGPRLSLMDLDAVLGGQTFTGQGESSFDGSLSLELASGARPMRLAGRLSPFSLEVVGAR